MSTTVNDPELVAEFVVESLEHLASIEGRLLEIEAAGPNVDLDVINQVFRAVHSAKGAAGFLGFQKISDLAHEIENVLNLQRTRELIATSESTDAVLRGIDLLRDMLNQVDESNNVDVGEHVSALRKFHGSAGAPANVTPEEFESGGDSAAEPSTPVAAVQSSGTRTAGGGGNSEGSIRVQVGLLDGLMTLAGELVLARNQLLQVAESRSFGSLDPVASRIDQITSELQGAVMRSRMQPIGIVFSRFTRIVRDLSTQLGKQCRLEVRGSEVELDKTIIEAIGDPLTHLIRNSLDHGVERPETRAQRGKPTHGTIQLTAQHQAGKVLITIVDDGAGINVARVKQKAEAAGLLTSEQAAALSDRDAVRLIFHPGLSTAEKVSEVSGRGVGMDVVKTNIERIGGTVDVLTRPGQGTTILVELPLTLAIIPSLIVVTGKERFALPQSSISELVRIKASDVGSSLERVNGAELLRLRGRLLPLVRLTTALGRDSGHAYAWTPDERRDAVNIIVVEAEQSRYGIIVDGLNDSEEIVVKPLGRHLKGCPCLAGATVLGDGHVALILDVVGIATHMQLARSSQEQGSSSPSSESQAISAETQSVLLFNYGSSELFAVPMAVIKRIERIRHDQISAIGGCELLAYRQSSVPLIKLDEHLKVAPAATTSRPYVLIFECNGREVGLLIPAIVDIRELSTEVDLTTFREPGVVGSLVVAHETIRILDVFELAVAAYPDRLAPPRRTTQGNADRKMRILLAEDSDFFRKQVAAFLESHDHEVVGCENGLAAWEELGDAATTYDLIVTDIEMPQLNGFELCRRVKDDPRFRHLPVIALTSLAGQEDMERGMQAGVNEYQVKMDRDKLLEAVTRLLGLSRRSRRAAQ